MSQIKIFVSYAHEDAEYKNQLLHACSVFKHNDNVKIWTDDKIRAGDKFDPAIEKELNESHICIVLVSKHYWSKEYIQQKELPIILQRHSAGELQIVPILVDGEKQIKYSPLNGMTFTPQIDSMLMEISSLDNPKKAWEVVFDEIDEKIKNVQAENQNKPQIKTDKNDTNRLNINVSGKKQKIAFLFPDPINHRFNFNIIEIVSLFTKFDAELHIKTLNEESLCECGEYDVALLFSQNSREKIAIETEYFELTYKSPDEIEKLIQISKPQHVYLITNKKIEANCNMAQCELDMSKQKQQLRDFVHKNIASLLKKGTAEKHYHNTELPDAIDHRNLEGFIGREAEMATLIQKILNIKNTHKVLSVKGSGGIGKTTTVSKAALEIAKRGFFKKSIAFISCEYISGYADFEQKTTVAMGMNNAADFRVQLTKLSIDEQDRLIILDNLETLLYLQDSEEIKSLIKLLSNYVSVVVTTREQMSEEYEDMYPLSPFSTDDAEALFIKLYRLDATYDKRLLRMDLLENMLNNNPLAIKLLCKNIPSGKTLTNLLEDLQNDFFDLTSVEAIEKIFDRESDMNIEKSKSLYCSIKYSYDRLDEDEKLAFELLSLFPDGIEINNLKILSQDKAKQHKPMTLTDRNIRSLENKSLIIISGGFVRLQSIIGRFAEYMFWQRDNKIKAEYYCGAFDYNLSMLDKITDLQDHTRRAKAFDKCKGNMLKTFDFAHYEEDINNLGKFIELTRIGLALTSPNDIIFTKLDTLQKNILDEHLIEAIHMAELTLRYFYGDFEKAFDEIKQKYPIESLSSCDISNHIKRSMYSGLWVIYGMEGFVIGSVEFDLSIFNKVGFPDLFQIGFFDLLQKYQNSNNLYRDNHFWQYEFDFARGILEPTKLKLYIKKLHKTQLIEKVQASYTMMKYDSGYLTKEEIERLVHTNPYAKGLKKLMLAIKEDELEEAKELYNKAIENLAHIKYYYTQALYLYCKFLKQHNDDEYQRYFDEGIELAKRCSYRYQLHLFNCLKSGSDEPYNEADYKLPYEFADLEEKIVKRLSK